MNTYSIGRLVVRLALVVALGLGVMQAAVGDVSNLSRADIGKVEAVLSKNLKGKPVVHGGTKQEVDGGWKINCRATVGSGGDFQFVVMTERSMTLGYVESQMPAVEPAATTGKAGRK